MVTVVVIAALSVVIAVSVLGIIIIVIIVVSVIVKKKYAHKTESKSSNLKVLNTIAVSICNSCILSRCAAAVIKC